MLPLLFVLLSQLCIAPAAKVVGTSHTRKVLSSLGKLNKKLGVIEKVREIDRQRDSQGQAERQPGDNRGKYRQWERPIETGVDGKSGR